MYYYYYYFLLLHHHHLYCSHSGLSTEAAAIKDKKKALKAKKGQCERDITSLIESTIAAQSQLQGVCAEYARELDELEALEAEYEKMSNVLKEQEKEIGPISSVEEIITANGALQNSISAAEDAVSHMHPELDVTQAQSDRIGKEVAALEESAQTTRGVNELLFKEEIVEYQGCIFEHLFFSFILSLHF